MTETNTTESEDLDNTEAEETADETAADSSTENNENGDGQSSEGQQGANTQDDADDDKPFHEHPRWKQRETEWDNRFNSQEQRHQEDMRKLREEFSTARKDNAENTQIPAWFGGTQEQWDLYRKDEDAKLAAAEERAVKRISADRTKQDEAVKEATAYMQKELGAIESDTTLNPTGAKIDPNKLLKVVLDNDLVDSQGRWNYKAGWRLMQQSGQAPKAPNTGDRKRVAAATTSENKGETKTTNVKTSADFKKNRPW